MFYAILRIRLIEFMFSHQEKMTLKLSQAEPVRILDAVETANHRRKLEEIETKYGPMHYRHKPYLLMKSSSEIARNPTLLDAIEDLLGPDILLWD